MTNDFDFDSDFDFVFDYDRSDSDYDASVAVETTLKKLKYLRLLLNLAVKRYNNNFVLDHKTLTLQATRRGLHHNNTKFLILIF